MFSLPYIEPFCPAWVLCLLGDPLNSVLVFIYLPHLSHLSSCDLARSLPSSHLLSSGNCCRGGRKRKTMKLSRDLSNLVVFTNSVASQECLNEGKDASALTLPQTQTGMLNASPCHHFLTPNPSLLRRYSGRCSVIQRDQGPVSGQSQSRTVPSFQPEAAVKDLPLSVSHRLVQFQPPVLLERRMPAG